jgi:hypothetical protein
MQMTSSFDSLDDDGLHDRHHPQGEEAGESIGNQVLRSYICIEVETDSDYSDKEDTDTMMDDKDPVFPLNREVLANGSPWDKFSSNDTCQIPSIQQGLKWWYNGSLRKILLCFLIFVLVLIVLELFLFVHETNVLIVHASNQARLCANQSQMHQKEIRQMIPTYKDLLARELQKEMTYLVDSLKNDLNAVLAEHFNENCKQHGFRICLTAGR